MPAYSTLPFDIIYCICSTVGATDRKALHELSLVDKRTRAACISLLFDVIVFDRQWSAEGVAWDGVAALVDALLSNSAIMKAVRTFHLQPWVGEPSRSPIPVQFFQLLFSLPNLTDLAVVLQIEYISQVKAIFNVIDNSLPRVGAKSLPTIRSLTVPTKEWMFISECCTNLRFLEISTSVHWYARQEMELDVVRWGQVHPKLTGLHCQETGLSHIIRAIAANLPQLRELGLYGCAYNRARGVLDHLNAYNDFKHLESLSLPDAADLGMGFYPPHCGNAYMSNPGLLEEVQETRRKTIGRLMEGIQTEIIMRKGSTLREVVIARRSWQFRTVWEKGSDGKLFESKKIECSRRTGKIIEVTKLNQ